MKILILALFVSSSAYAADPLTNELKRYFRDAKSLSAAPLRWNQKQWVRFGEGVAAVAIVYAADRQIYDAVQRNRNTTSNDFAKTITPFGGHRALEMSALLIAAGALSHNDNMRDAGRDSLEAEFWAAGVVTPLLKRSFGRARPSQGEGDRSFTPFNKGRESFPSGHATNAFAFATAVAGHYDGWVVPTIVYSMATGVALSRVNDRAHWASDVLAGALIGRTVARGIVVRHANLRISFIVVPVVGNPKIYPKFIRRE